MKYTKCDRRGEPGDAFFSAYQTAVFLELEREEILDRETAEACIRRLKRECGKTAQ